MAWTLHRVTWRLESPLHSGFAKLGNIQRTRPYVTGRMLWGAVTARLTRDLGRNDYDVVGDKVNECLRFSYGYLCLTEDGSQPLLPEFTAKGLRFNVGGESLTEREVQRLCLTSYASTALDYANNAAVDGSLHEVEFISPRALCAEDRLRIKAGQPLYLTARIAEAEEVSNNAAVKDWKSLLQRLEIGGERTYGFGRLRLENCLPAGNDWFGGEFYSVNGSPRVKVSSGTPTSAHVTADCKVRHGRVEPLVGRRTTPNAEFGKEIEYSGVYCVPGAVLEEDVNSFLVGAHGLWQVS